MKERWTVRWFRKRALLYHLLVLILAPGCLYAGWWQVQRAESGNTLSYLYTVEWPIFAILSVIGWWQLIHEDPAAVESRQIERARRAANRGPFVPPPPEADSGFYHPLQPGSHAPLGTGDGANGSRATLARTEAGTAAPRDDVDADAAPVHALSSYNAYLARLSAGGGRKSWRNPHGITAATIGAEPPPAVAPVRDRHEAVAGPVPPVVGSPSRPAVPPAAADRWAAGTSWSEER